MLGSSSGNSICKQKLGCPVLSSNGDPNLSSQSAFGSPSNSPASSSMTSAPLFGTNLFASTPQFSPFRSSSNGDPFGGNLSSQSAFVSPSNSPASSMTSAPLFGTNLFANTSPFSPFRSTTTNAPFRTPNPCSTSPKPRFGCGFIFPKPPVVFDYSKTPLHCFLKFPPSSQPPTFTFTNPGTPLFPQITSSPGGQTSKFKCSYCGAPNVDDPSAMIKSVSALPPYQAKSHEELRWEAKGNAPVNASPTLFALPLLMLPVNTALGSYPLLTLTYSGTGTTPPLVQPPSTNFLGI